jgi:hypothetical protein
MSGDDKIGAQRTASEILRTISNMAEAHDADLFGTNKEQYMEWKKHKESTVRDLKDNVLSQIRTGKDSQEFLISVADQIKKQGLAPNLEITGIDLGHNSLVLRDTHDDIDLEGKPYYLDLDHECIRDPYGNFYKLEKQDKRLQLRDLGSDAGKSVPAEQLDENILRFRKYLKGR